MEVLVVAEQLRQRVPGGIGTYIQGLFEGLSAMSANAPSITVYASRLAARDLGGQGVDPIGAVGFPVISSRLPGGVLRRAWSSGLVGLPAHPAAREWDIVHAPSLAYPRRGRTPLCAVVHDLAWRQVPEAFTRHGVAWHEKALWRTLSSARSVVVPSEDTAVMLQAALAGGKRSDLLEWNGSQRRRAGGPRIAVIPLGVDHMAAPDLPGADALLDALGVEGSYVVCVGTLEPRKNLVRLIEAFDLAGPRLGQGWSLVVVGPRGWGEGPPPSKGVFFTGPVVPEVLSGLYARAAMAAYVPLVEGWGLPAVEAMAAGLAVVASAVPSTGGAALEVDPTDVGAISEALVAVATDEAQRARLVEAGKNRVAGLTWLATAELHVALWESAA